MVTGSADKLIKIWKAGRCVHTLKGKQPTKSRVTAVRCIYNCFDTYNGSLYIRSYPPPIGLSMEECSLVLCVYAAMSDEGEHSDRDPEKSNGNHLGSKHPKKPLWPDQCSLCLHG